MQVFTRKENREKINSEQIDVRDDLSTWDARFKEAINNEGLKEECEKLPYELDWEFVQGMAERMNMNKGKYPPYNWQKDIDIGKLKQAMARHFIEIQKGNYDDEQILGHLYAISLNAMMITYQLKKL